MRINRITAKNYRTLEDISVDLPSNYCTISGHNNAGKSCMILLISHLLNETEVRPWLGDDDGIVYKDDKTKWVNGTPDISISYKLQINSIEDQVLAAFIKRVSGLEMTEENTELTINIRVNVDNVTTHEARVAGTGVTSPVAKDILDKIRSSKTLFLHNSTKEQNDYYYRAGRHIALYNIPLSAQDQGLLKEAENQLQRQIKKVAKSQTGELNSMLGKLSDKFDVQFSAIDTSSNRRVHLGINLTDKNVEMPLPSWGSGTQNRTRVLMSVLQANRIRTGEEPENRITPIVVIEEPESFLHPSAQADFGKVLQALSEELKIQIIVSTHSPYMLNQVSPPSNILMKRKVSRGKTLSTQIVKTDAENWMAPFAEHLGVVPPEFENWRQLFGSKGSRVVLVEGDIDRDYIDFLRSTFPLDFQLPEDVEIVPYGGKDALRNTLLIKFILSRIATYFVTFDLDAAQDTTKFLEKIGLVANRNFSAVGQGKAGRQAIEGLLPDRVLQAVHGRETDLMMMLGSGSSDERRQAKSNLKQRLLAEFKSQHEYSKEELAPLFQLGKTISKPFLP